MNTYRKIGPDQWGIATDDKFAVGASIEVTLKSGATKQVTLGAFRVHQYGKFVYEIAPAAVAPAPRQSAAVGDLAGVMALFAKAKQHLKFPAIVLGVPALGPDASIRISVAGDRAKVPGSLTVLEGERDEDGGDRKWLGRILLDGSFQPSAAGRDPAIAARLREFAADPSNVAGKDGRLHGRCCFCRLPLKDARSTAAGYGKTCASHFGLAWGAKPAEFAGEAVEQQMQLLEAAGDREQTHRDECAKHEARRAMELS